MRSFLTARQVISKVHYSCKTSGILSLEGGNNMTVSKLALAQWHLDLKWWWWQYPNGLKCNHKVRKHANSEIHQPNPLASGTIYRNDFIRSLRPYVANTVTSRQNNWRANKKLWTKDFRTHKKVCFDWISAVGQQLKAAKATKSIMFGERR